MPASFRLGTILGFEVSIHYSWFIIFLLVFWTFAAQVFPAGWPGFSTTTYVAMGGAMTLLFFASLLAHELSHSLVARGKGIPVEGITLFIFGGIARTRMEAESPGDEFQIAGIGPLTSFGLAGLFALLAWAADEAGITTAVTAVAWYLAFLNGMLAVFNLIPGFPLDGGRLFRALAWKLSGSLTRATRWASIGGRIFGYTLIGYGAWRALGGWLLDGFWLILIGWFLRNAALGTWRQQLAQDRLRGVRARDAMTPAGPAASPEITLQELVGGFLLGTAQQAYPVGYNGRAVGLVTLEQVTGLPREEWPARTVGEVMTPIEDVALVRPDDSVLDVLRALERAGTAHALVLGADGRPQGLITRRDVARFIAAPES